MHNICWSYKYVLTSIYQITSFFFPYKFSKCNIKIYYTWKWHALRTALLFIEMSDCLHFINVYFLPKTWSRKQFPSTIIFYYKWLILLLIEIQPLIHVFILWKLYKSGINPYFYLRGNQFDLPLLLCWMLYPNFIQ